MELRVLHYFLAVAQEESITKAADFLHITQPTLSRQLMELEVELGAKLMIRGNRNQSIVLTAEGMLLRKRAEEIVELSNRTKAELAASADMISGDVYIGGGESDAMRLIARTARALQREYPQIKYHLFSGNADDLRERLDKGLLDFGLLIEPASTEKYEHIRLPAVDTWGLLLRKDRPLAEKKSIRPEDLQDLPLLTSRQSLVRGTLSDWYGHGIERLNIVATYNLLYNASLMVEEGIGYALCLDKLVNPTGSSLCFRPLEPPLEAHLDLVWKKHRMFSKAAELFLNKMVEADAFE